MAYHFSADDRVYDCFFGWHGTVRDVCAGGAAVKVAYDHARHCFWTVASDLRPSRRPPNHVLLCSLPGRRLIHDDAGYRWQYETAA